MKSRNGCYEWTVLVRVCDVVRLTVTELREYILYYVAPFLIILSKSTVLVITVHYNILSISLYIQGAREICVIAVTNDYL